MKLVWNWKRIVLHSWSFRIAVLSAVFSTALSVLPMAAKYFSLQSYAITMLIVQIGAGVLRLIHQQEVSGKMADKKNG
jgi:maltodextrin utilization protein YvdJ